MCAISVIAVLLTLGTDAFAVSTCDSFSFIPCLTPILSYAFSPETWQLFFMKDPSQITEDQAIKMCRTGQSAAQCFQDVMDRCEPGEGIPDISEYFAGARKIMAVCDRPDFYPSFRILMDCGRRLYPMGGQMQVCSDSAIRESINLVVNYTQAGPTNVLEMWRNGDIMKQMCCYLDFYKSCGGTEITDRCGPDAQQVFDNAFDTASEAFNCYGERMADCPARMASNAAQASLDLHFTRLITSIVNTIG